MKTTYWPTRLLALAFFAAMGCNTKDEDGQDPLPGATLTEVATSQVQWTGVAVARDGRVFANYPRMETDTIPYSVAYVSGAQATPFPNADWNNWNPSLPPQDHFICVQSVHVDDQNNLWVLDPASPQMRGVVKGGAKLLKFNPATGALIQRIVFEDEMIVYPTSYLNDVRIDTQKNYAYITDSGQGALIVVNLTTGKARRLLSRSPTTKSEGVVVTAEGRVWRNNAGKVPSFDADGIGLTPQRDYVYFHAITARPLYRIATAALQDESLSESQLNQRVEKVRDTDPVDGMLFDPAGNLYLTYIQQNAVERLTPAGDLQRVVEDTRLKWPDSFAYDPDSSVYVTTSQLHIPRLERTDPYRLFKFKAPR
ncbi:SMP-30/gluconolactonase/LRE family protein [Spirosoma oryzicola]|uniref:SMP-30/gluconolactonase/LRE family protein n=1 Tax=Spirosoma oryzicola TaxID=2898794 RepID=UPI001E485864|nr:major royal jelly family protein [Spirosoma oryzicola]UHG93531.1 major royal jelly family protein [Spirosoma oryzicola]